MIKKKSVLAAAAIGAVALSGLAVSSSWAGTGESLNPANPDLRVLNAQARSATDSLPALIAESGNHEDLLLDTARSLKASGDGNKYWVIRNDADEICMMAWTPENIAGTTCAKPEEFNHGGLAIQVVGQASASEAYLFPDSVTTSNNLVTVNPFDNKKADVQSRNFDTDKAKKNGFTLEVLPTPDFIPDKLQEMAAGN